jgi:predicted lipoprotein
MTIDVARRRLVVAGLAAAVWPALPVGAQQMAGNVALPFYQPPDVVQGAWRQWLAPRARDLVLRAEALAAALSAACVAPGGAGAMDAARVAWAEAALAYGRLSAVSVGPLLRRRSTRQIDFAPTRPELIRRAIASAPADLQALERIGTPAKGLPALEWLLWPQPVEGSAGLAGAPRTSSGRADAAQGDRASALPSERPSASLSERPSASLSERARAVPGAALLPGAAGCRYAALLAEHLLAEARALDQAFGALAGATPAPDDEAAAQAAAVAMAELVNQWIGGLERLRWPFMDKPLRSAAKGRPPAYPRAASGLVQPAWAAHWQGLRTLALAAGDAVPQPGIDLVTLETYVRSRGLNALADRWVAAVRKVDDAMAGARPDEAASVRAASQALAGLKQLAEAELAPALDIRIGFSDADGD